MDIQTVKDFIEWSEGFPYVEVKDAAKWCIEEYSVNWSSVDFTEDDWEYSSEILGVLGKDGLVLVNTDNGCGETITLVFLESMEVKDGY